MKALKILIALLFLTSLSVNSQSLNQEFQKDGKQAYLIGKIDKSGLESSHYKNWFAPNYKAYKVDTETVSLIKNELKNHDIKLFMATWCGDSKGEVPKFLKILEAADYPMDKLTIVAVSGEKDSYKESPEHEEAGLNIVRVPTFILFKDGKEVNRIIEEPIETLEKDLQTILTTTRYKPNYYGMKKKPKSLKKIAQ